MDSEIITYIVIIVIVLAIVIVTLRTGFFELEVSKDKVKLRTENKSITKVSEVENSKVKIKKSRSSDISVSKISNNSKINIK